MNKLLLLLGNITAGGILIILQNKNILPLQMEYFVFFTFVLFLFSLYRPGWTFLLFIGMLPFETVEFARFGGSIDLRPYQWLAVVLLLSVSLRFVLGKLPFKLFRPGWPDIFPVIILAGALLSAFFSPLGTSALKQAIVLGSFTMIYFLGRIFLRTFGDVRRIVPFFLTSSLVIFVYSLWQNIRFLSGQSSFEIMAGRPNATFSEADWLGVFTLFALTILWALSSHIVRKHSNERGFIRHWKSFMKEPVIWMIFFLEVLAFTVLLIAVSRSAWLGAAMGFIVIFLASVFREKFSPSVNFCKLGFWLGGMTARSFLFAVLLVWVGHLTSFNLFQRAASTAGLQTITVACEQDALLPKKIESLEELSSFGCQHIRLEEKAEVAAAGKFVKEVSRDDPNVSIRQETYGEVWKLIVAQPFLGIGWGNAATFLGTDERGAGLNASNIFLEVWLGSGLLGFVAFLVWWVVILLSALRGFLSQKDEDGKTFSYFLIGAWVALSVFNFFNSGILLGFFFLFLALGSLAIERESPKFLQKNT